jgi:crossover junction endodeoxyribonuclease RusA
VTLTIQIPRPVPALSPNARVFWAKVARAKQSARHSALRMAMAEWGNCVPRWPRATVRVLWIMPTKAHHPDPDNAIASLKPWLDGFADWGVVANDKGLVPVWGGIRVEKSAEWPRGCVVLTFERSEG